MAILLRFLKFESIRANVACACGKDSDWSKPVSGVEVVKGVGAEMQFNEATPKFAGGRLT